MHAFISPNQATLRQLLWALAFVSVVVAGFKPAQSSTLSGSYTLSSKHVDTAFSVGVLGRKPVTGAFKKISGKMVLDQNRPEKSRVSVTVDLRSVETSNAKVTGFLKSSAMFDVTNHPKATFQSTRVRITGKNSADVEGVLTLRGKTQRTKLSVNINGASASGRVTFEVLGGFFRSQYGMEAGLPIYADKVKLTITGTGRRG